MTHPSPFRGAAAAATLWLVAAGAATAQGNPVTPAAPGPAGACGQPMALTHALGRPLDQAAPAGVVPLPLDRLEPAYVEFALAARSRVTLETESPTSTDLFLALFDAAGRLIDSDDDGAGGLQAMLSGLDLAPGRYCAQVRVYGWSDNMLARGGLRLEAVPVAGGMAGGVAGLDPSRPCGDPALVLDAGRLVAPGFGGLSLTATVAQGSRRDWRMTVAAPVALTLEAMSPIFDTVLELYDSTGRMIAENDDRPQGGTDSEIVEVLPAGDYCISVRGWSGGGGAVQLVLSEGGAPPVAAPPAPAPFPGPAGAADQPCGLPERTLEAGRFAPGFGRGEFAAAIGRGGWQDIRFGLDAGMRVMLEALGRDGFDPILSLHDATGRMIAGNDDRPQGGTDSEIIETLAAGNYCARIVGFLDSSGAAVFALSEAAATGAPGLPGVPGLPGLPGAAAPGGMAATGPCGDPARTAALGTVFGPGLPALALAGRSAPGGWQDWQLAAGAMTEARLTARSTEFDTMLELYDATGRMIAENDDAPGMGTDSEIVTGLVPGDYCLRVTGFAGSGGAYDLSLAAVGAPAPAAPAPAPAGPALAAPPPGAVEAIGTLGEMLEASRTEAGQTLWLGFTVAEAGRFELRGLSLGGSLVMQLTDSGGAALGQATSGGGFDIAQMTAELAPGSYRVALHWPGGGGRAAVRQLVVTRQ